MHAWQFMKALGTQRQNGWARFVSMQNHINLLYREEEREMLPLCRSEGIGVVPWSPLARGRLTRPWQDEPATARAAADQVGKGYYDKAKEADRAVVERVGVVAERRGVPRAQIALAWLLHKEGVTAPLIGATKMQQLEDAVAAIGLKLSEYEISALEELYTPHAVSGFE
jgi:aryl-alcohol dehydrogenase-like predicted oxidoreductase